jgi:chloramphenicol-sensitive protein RarD
MKISKGILYGIGAYLCWGLFPLYWKMLHDVAALQLLGHRIAWSFVLLLAVIFLRKEWPALRAAMSVPRTLLIYGVAALLIGVNWGTYVWAVNAGHIVETSLGYFINPLVSVMFGVIFFRERLRPFQWLPVGLAAIGVLYLAYEFGSPPWIALTLAGSFGLYGLVKKLSPLNSLHGLTLETGALFLPALIYLSYEAVTGAGAFGQISLGSDLLLIGAGVVTTIPLLMFTSAARSIPLSMLGILQYIAPTMQFFLGVLVYREPFSQTQLIGFSIVWFALIVFTVEGLISRRNTPVIMAPAD